MVVRPRCFRALAVAAVLVSASVQAKGGQPAPAKGATPARAHVDLILSGTVLSISQGKGLLKPWIVRLDVTKVLLGAFPGSSFTFAVHSPARAGLEVGHTYEVKATRHGDGYVVDELQFRPFQAVTKP